ncbi:MAG: glutathione transferase GstA [Sphingomicrobium sp.]
MKLYYAPGACSQAPHIILHETGMSHTVEKVDLKEKRTESGKDYWTINPKGSVPALELDNGEVLTENAVVLQFIGDRSGLEQVLPPMGDFRRYRVLEWVNYITTELHKSFGPLFNPAASEETKRLFIEQIGKKLDYIEGELGDRPFLVGDRMTLPDAYLFVMLSWGEKMIGLDRWPGLRAFREHMLEHNSVRQVLEFEGLLEPQPAG